VTIPVASLGHSGLVVSRLALGTMMFGSWGNPDRRECHRMVHRAIDAGITLFDTADMYDDGASESILGEALRGRRDHVVVATKVGNPMAGDPYRSGLSARWIEAAVDDSLRRLGIDHIDLYQMHRPDPATPIDETLETLDRLVSNGKVGAIGTSTFPPDLLDALHRTAAHHAWARPTSEQPPYSLLARGIEQSVLPMLRRLDVGAIVWAPLNGGWLTGKYQHDDGDDAARARRQPDHFDHRHAPIRGTKRSLVARLHEVAHDANMSLPQLALAFVVDQPSVTAAIIGPRTLEQLDQLLDQFVEHGVHTLPPEVHRAIDEIVPPGHNVNPADAD
jgi:aryl-alcohol dehydrogenase-like predicted oxidoreductase